MKKTIKVYKSRNIKVWIAKYETLDIVSQGKSKQEAINNLLDCIIFHIDFAIANGNLENLKP